MAELWAQLADRADAKSAAERIGRRRDAAA
jgi:hypothetical protein